MDELDGGKIKTTIRQVERGAIPMPEEFKYILLSIPLEPTPKARARTIKTKKGYMSYTPKKTTDAEDKIRNAFVNSRFDKFNFDVPLYVDIKFYVNRPKTISKKKIFPITRPDLDNYAKLVTDALEKFAYDNDSQIVTMQISKKYSDSPHIDIYIYEEEVPYD